jgi:hypothetical protein
MRSDLVGWAGFEPATSASRTGLQPCEQVVCSLRSTGWRLLESMSRPLWRKALAGTPTLAGSGLSTRAAQPHSAPPRQAPPAQIAEAGMPASTLRGRIANVSLALARLPRSGVPL